MGPDRRYELLRSTEAYEVWVIGWPVGSRLAAHDHGGSAGAFHVVTGELTETVFDGASGSIVERRDVVAAAGVAFHEDHVHDVRNSGFETAVSIHVYAPRLGALRFYGGDPA